MELQSTLRVLVLCREQGAMRLRSSCPRWCRFTTVATVADAIRAIAARAIELVVIDPAWAKGDASFEVAFAAAAQGIEILVYAPLDRATAPRIARLLRHVPCELLLWGAHAESQVIVEHLRQFAPPTAAAIVLRTLITDHATGDTGFIARTVLGLFGCLPIPERVAILVADAGVTERTLERQFTRFGLAGPRHVLTCARVVRAWEPLCSGLRVESLIRHQGWSSSDQFRARFKRCITLTPTEAKGTLDTEEFARRLLRSIRRPE